MLMELDLKKDEHKAFIVKNPQMDDANGTYNARYCYHHGIGLKKDEHKAFIYCQKSADGRR